MPSWLRWFFGLAIAAMLVIVPIMHLRSVYAFGKRLREVVPARVYRSGQLTAEGFEDVIRRYHIRTVINAQDEFPDPDIERSFLSGDTVKETALCDRLHVRYVFLPPNLISRRRIPAERPEAIDRFLALLDDESSYPVLIHCKAGLHRTGLLAAVYRMEYQGWNPDDAIDELKAIGFGEFACSSDNDYVRQYILTYQRGVRNRVAQSR